VKRASRNVVLWKKKEKVFSRVLFSLSRSLSSRKKQKKDKNERKRRERRRRRTEEEEEEEELKKKKKRFFALANFFTKAHAEKKKHITREREHTYDSNAFSESIDVVVVVVHDDVEPGERRRAPEETEEKLFRRRHRKRNGRRGEDEEKKCVYDFVIRGADLRVSFDSFLLLFFFFFFISVLLFVDERKETIGDADWIEFIVDAKARGIFVVVVARRRRARLARKPFRRWRRGRRRRRKKSHERRKRDKGGIIERNRNDRRFEERNEIESAAESGRFDDVSRFGALVRTG